MKGVTEVTTRDLETVSMLAPLSLLIEEMAHFFHKSDEPPVRSLESLLKSITPPPGFYNY